MAWHQYQLLGTEFKQAELPLALLGVHCVSNHVKMRGFYESKAYPKCVDVYKLVYADVRYTPIYASCVVHLPTCKIM